MRIPVKRQEFRRPAMSKTQLKTDGDSNTIKDKDIGMNELFEIAKDNPVYDKHLEHKLKIQQKLKRKRQEIEDLREKELQDENIFEAIKKEK